MMAPAETLLLAASVLLLVSIIASKTSGRLGVLALLFFLLIGMLPGSKRPRGIDLDEARLAQSLGVLALALILFAGSVDTDWRSVRRAVLRELAVPVGASAAGKRLLDLGLPPGALVVLLWRGDRVIIPDGGTAIEAGDALAILAEEQTHAAIRPLVKGGGRREAPG